jgi:hypothetical protein
MAQAPRTHCDNYDTFILAQNVQDEMGYNDTLLATKFLQQSLNFPPTTIQIFGNSPPSSENNTPTMQDTTLWRTPAQVAPPTYGGEIPVNTTLGDQVTLLGYDLQQTDTQLIVTLYWQAIAPFDDRYQAFVHLFDGTENIAQLDTAPECAANPTTRWEAGQIIPDPHIIDLPANYEGDVVINAGMYNLLTLNRLTTPNNPNNLIQLQTLTLK